MEKNGNVVKMDGNAMEIDENIEKIAQIFSK